MDAVCFFSSGGLKTIFHMAARHAKSPRVQGGSTALAGDLRGPLKEGTARFPLRRGGKITRACVGYALPE